MDFAVEVFHTPDGRAFFKEGHDEEWGSLLNLFTQAAARNAHCDQY